jgi:hypothetical protein
LDAGDQRKVGRWFASATKFPLHKTKFEFIWRVRCAQKPIKRNEARRREGCARDTSHKVARNPLKTMLCVRHRRFAQGGLVLLIVVVWVERKANSNSQFNGLTDLTVLFSEER